MPPALRVISPASSNSLKWRARSALDRALTRAVVGLGGSALAGAQAKASSRSSATRTSRASRMRCAPSRSKRLHPDARVSSGCPGTAITSRPCSAAMRAVIIDPDLNAASITTIPRDSPEMMRLRLGKWRAWGARPIGISDRRKPICAASSAFSGG